MNTEPATDQAATPAKPRRSRRAEPITKRVARNGAVSWEFRCDVGVLADGHRDRRRFTFGTYKQARDEYRRITSEVRKGTFVRPLDVTVEQACEQWLAGRRGVRAITLKGYRDDLKPVCKRLGSRKMQEITKRDGDELVAWMLSEGRCDTRHYQPASLSGRIAEMIDQHPDGIAAAVIAAAFPDKDVHTPISGLLRAGRVARLRRATYAPATGPASADAPQRGVSAVAVRSTLRTFTAVMQSFVDQGALARNVIALVERPRVAGGGGGDAWNVDEVRAFIDSVRGERLFACWLLSCFGLRRSEVLGLRWSDVDGDTLHIRRGRVAVGNTTVIDEPKSARSRRDLPMPAELVEALRTLKIRQREEVLALGVEWSDVRHIAVREDGQEIRPEWFSREFYRLCQRAGLRKIKLHGLRNTSTSLMYASGIPPHITASWHGHDPAVSLSVYSHAQPEDLRAAGAKLFR